MIDQISFHAAALQSVSSQSTPNGRLAGRGVIYSDRLGGHMCLAFTRIFLFSILRALSNFWDLTTHDDFVPCVLRANYLWMCCIIKDQVFGMRALEGSFNIWLASKHLLQFV